jgi:predicted Zn-ribbon and HTH transcriptional regulator
MVGPKISAGSACSAFLVVTLRRDLIAMLSAEPRSVSAVAREMGLARRDAEDHLRHAIQSARAAGHQVVIESAKCRQCGFTFGPDKLSKPGKCPECKGTRIYEAQTKIESSANE